MEYYNAKVQEGIRHIARFIFSSYFKITLTGEENIPKKGPSILCFNHVHGYDPFIISSKVGKLKYAMAKKELFFPGFRNIMRMIGGYPVDSKPEKNNYKEFSRNYGLLIPRRKHAEFLSEINQRLLPSDRLSDLSGLDYDLFTEYVLCKGDSLLIHLPGTRVSNYEEIRHPKKGAARKALEMLDKHGVMVPVIPGGIVYNHKNKPLLSRKYLLPLHTGVDISFGLPVTAEQHYDEYKKNPDRAVHELTDVINREIDKRVKEIIRKINNLNSQS